MKVCPFVYGRVLKSREFYNRKGELRRVLGRLITDQSTALIGQPHIGKTSFLNYLLDESVRRSVVEDRLDHSIFSFIDSQMLCSHFDQQAFWKQALVPLVDHFSTGTIYETYKTVAENQFGTFTLEQLFAAIGKAGRHFVLVVDEFDVLLNHQMLNKTEFYGGLRALASRCPGFALIIASRRSLSRLNMATQQINPHGSPYFNIFTEIRLGPLPKSHAQAVLTQAGDVFGKRDIDFLLHVSGSHPYLLQLTAAILWEINTRDDRQKDDRYREASDEIYNQANALFEDTWNFLSNDEKKIITAIALAQIPELVENHKFSWKSLIEDISDYSKELRRLKGSGTIEKAGENGWRITQQAFLWWLADEIKRVTRDGSSFEKWLGEQEMEGLFTSKERKKMGEAASIVSGLLGKGAATLIESFAKGIASGTAKMIGL